MEKYVPLWFMTVEYSFNLKCVNNKKHHYKFSIGALELRHLERIEHIYKNLDLSQSFSKARETL